MRDWKKANLKSRYIKYLTTLVKQPRLLCNYRNIVLLSHMRSNSSLTGHLIGSHPEINGYYEIQQDYLTNSDFLLQKIKYAMANNVKPNSHFFFDKLLHNGVNIDCNLMIQRNAIVFISLRDVNATIPSIVKLAKRENWREQSEEYATRYLSRRLDDLANYAQQLKGKYAYFDADLLRDNSEETLNFITNVVGLETPIPSEYNVQSLTGIGGAGDTSDAIKSGKIIPNQSISKDNAFVSDLAIQDKFNDVRALLINNSHSSLTY